MTARDVLEKFDALNIWSRGGERAVNKPLLLLFALGRWSQGDEVDLPYTEVEDKLRKLLMEFGPPRHTVHPEYAFYRLQNDGVWTVHTPAGLRSGAAGEPLVSDMKVLNIRAGFSEDVKAAFRSQPELVTEIAARVLEQHFPDSLHEDILDEVGMSLQTKSKTAKKRDPRFRERILVAYGYQCALCGFDLKLGTTPIAIDAAHIMWHQAGGPDLESNGFALCSTHHKLFDYGAFTVRPGGTVLVSELAHGVVSLEHFLTRHHGERVRTAVNPDYAPAPGHLDWHHEQVFKKPHRHLSG
jgi:putative restriction endonuclease